jgi:hypothetical protein
MDNDQDYKLCWFFEDVVLDRVQFRAKVDEVVWFMTHESHVVPLKQERLMYLYDEEAMMKRALYSLCKDDKNRMESIIDGVNAIGPDDLNTYKHVIFFMQTSEDYPLIMSELNKLQDLTMMFSSTTEILWGLGVNNTLDDRLFFMLVCSK